MGELQSVSSDSLFILEGDSHDPSLSSLSCIIYCYFSVKCFCYVENEG